MATYNLDYGKLDSLLDKHFSSGTENAIIEAIKLSGMNDGPRAKFEVETEKASGDYKLAKGVDLFLDLGANNKITIHGGGHQIIASGDHSNSILDMGPGGDTLVGGLGADKLQVTHGANLLMAGAGQNTLIGGTGHDTLIGGGSSWLQAGSGGSTLIGGLGSESRDGKEHERAHESRDGKEHERDHDRDHGKERETAAGHKLPSDTLVGGAHSADVLKVTHGDNLLKAGGGRDTIFGGDGHDTILGAGSDTINVNYGDEYIKGGAGHDVVNVGLHGNDSIFGGHDTVVYSQQSASNIVKETIGQNDVTTITFSNHQVLTLQKVTIEFADGGHKHN